MSPSPDMAAWDEASLQRLASKVGELLAAGGLSSDDRPAAVAPRPAELRDAVLPLLLWRRNRSVKDGRGLVGIVGPPGAGKTLLASWLAAAAQALSFRECAFVSLDGYHLPNAALDALTGTDPEGNVTSLRKLKGTPATYDADRLLADLRSLKSSREERSLPAYSRVLHEPVADRIRIGPEVDWVFVEGNYLFLDGSPWRDICGLLDRRVFIDADDRILRERLAGRHAAAGRDAQWIKAHFRRTDGPDIRLVRESARCADVALRWDSSGLRNCPLPLNLEP